MMLLQSAVAVLALASGVVSQKPYAVTGVPTDIKNGVPLRLNINQLQSNGGAQWDLYILALSQMQAANSDDPLSYFQVGGIHGRPFIQWNGTGAGVGGSGWQGYCPHGENLFLSWHRPFVMLFEQVLVERAKAIANTYPTQYRAQYQAAAASLRSPYWDWSADTYVPPSTVPATMSVNIPNGNALKKVNVNNPLASFRFPTAAINGKYGAFDSQRRPATVRCPSPNTYPGTANANLAKRPYKQWTYDTFTRSKTFNEFASTGTSGISLELIHNGIHWDGGCGNHFLSADFSGFDPLFMLHHTNVDRLWAYWSAMNPSLSVFTGSYSGGARWSSRSGASISPSSGLAPFYNAKGQLYTSQSVASIQGFGYTYAGVEYWKKSAAQMKADVTATINRLYGKVQGKKRSNDKRAPATTTRYFVSVELEVSDIPRPAELIVYVGGARAGSMVIMQQPVSGITHGEFGLDPALQQTGIQSQSAPKAVDSIQSQLAVEIVKHDGTLVALDTVPSLKFSLENVTETAPESITALPKFGKGSRRPARVADRSRRGGKKTTWTAPM